MGRIVLVLMLLTGCSGKIQEATSPETIELPGFRLEPGARYIFFGEDGARATTDPGEIRATTASGVSVFHADKTPVLPAPLDWGLNFYGDLEARVESRQAIGLRAYAGAAGDWAAGLVRQRSVMLAWDHPDSEASRLEAEQQQALAERLAGVPGAEKLQSGSLNRARAVRWAGAVLPVPRDFGLSAPVKSRVVFVTRDCKTCEVWRRRAKELADIEVVELRDEVEILRYRKMFESAGVRPQVPAMVEGGRIQTAPEWPLD